MNDARIRALINSALDPRCFFVAPGGSVGIEHQPRDACAWEIFQGHLLDASQTHLTKVFESWQVVFNSEAEQRTAPTLSVKFDASQRLIHVTRRIFVYARQAYEAEGRQILTRDITKWKIELVGTIDLARTDTPVVLGRQLAYYLFLAIVGTSRLPVTSLESPLPGFSLARFAYFSHRDTGPSCEPMVGWRDLIRRGLTIDLSPMEQAKLLETVLRTAKLDEAAVATDVFVERWRAIGLLTTEIPTLFRTLFNHLALSPYTHFVEHLVVCLRHLADRRFLGPQSVIDLFSYLLRHLVRHLTAFDLVRFHNRGANYPDALMLDAMLQAYLAMIDQHADAFKQKHCGPGIMKIYTRRRRALRQAWLIRKQYEGHRVPDAPTSPGENERVLPSHFVRVPDEQITRTEKRQRQLFSDERVEDRLTPTTRRVLEQSMHDLESTAELCELGMAVYLDRPLGIFKDPGEIDRTPLVSYEAFSRRVAERRLKDLQRLGLLTTRAQYESLVRRLQEQALSGGVPAGELSGQPRRGAVALEDAQKAAMDFRILRTTRQSLNDVLCQYDFSPLHAIAHGLVDWLFTSQNVLLVRSPGWSGATSAAFLTVFDQHMQRRLELAPGQNSGGPVRYLEYGGREYLEHGLRVLRLWKADATGVYRELDLTGQRIRLLPRR
jgi:hypothetical protein